LGKAAVRIPNASNTTIDNDPMEGNSKSTMVHPLHSRIQSIVSDVSIVDSESSLSRGFRNLFNSPSNEDIDGK
jgi:hypothetical protein